jgi:integrase
VLADVTPPWIADCLRLLQQGDDPCGERLGPATRNRYLAVLSAIFRWLWHRREAGSTATLLGASPVCRNLTAGFVSCQGDECRELLAAAKANDSPRFPSGAPGPRDRRPTDRTPAPILAGCRPTERLPRIHKTKNRDPKTCPIRGQALEALREWARTRVRTLGSDFVFGEPGVTYSQAVPLFPRKRWEVMRDAANLKDFRFHDLRHTTGSFLAMSGATARDNGDPRPPHSP